MRMMLKDQIEARKGDVTDVGTAMWIGGRGGKRK